MRFTGQGQAPPLPPYSYHMQYSCLSSALRPPLADHEIVEGIFRHLPPQILVGAEREIGIGDLLEARTVGAELAVEIIGGLVAGLHDVLRKQPQLRAADDEAF